MQAQQQAGDFTGLAKEYSENRPDYSISVMKGILGLIDKPIKDIDFVDVGAGTGIWSRMVYGIGVNSIISIEPNSDMRDAGINDSQSTKINWMAGSAEQTGLSNESTDWLSMASSFHWADFAMATKEFHRVIRPGGLFTALWNPRLIEVNPILIEIEDHLKTLRPNIKRVSSGRSGMTETLTERLNDSPFFEDIIYMEGRHVIKMPPHRYIGAWRSVNDLLVQLGRDKFNKFLEFIEARIDGVSIIEATYLTRSWSARRKS